MILIPIFSFLNLARGRQFFVLKSTTLGRLLSTALMASATALEATPSDPLIFAWMFPLLMFWSVFAWDKYWAMCIGSPTDISAPACPPIDWLMSKLPLKGKAWGVVAMGLRQAFAIPALIALAIITNQPFHVLYAPLTLFLGLPYYIAGCLVPLAYAVPLGELLTGGALGAIATFVL